MDKTWYFDSFNGILNPISAIRTMCDSIRTNARRDGMGAIEDSGRKLYDLCNDMEHQIYATINLMNFSKDYGIKSSIVYSDSFDEMIQKDFTYKGRHYTWNDLDCVYYNNNGDEDDFFMEIPKGAITSSKAIKSDYSDEEYWYPEGTHQYVVQIENRKYEDSYYTYLTEKGNWLGKKQDAKIFTDINEAEYEKNDLQKYFYDEGMGASYWVFVKELNKINNSKSITSAKKPVKGMTKPEGEVLREVEDDVGCLIQLVKLTNGKYLVTDNWQTEDICDNLKEANIKFNEYFM